MPKSKEETTDGKHGLIYGMNAGDIEQKILSYLSVREEEKDKYGEVFTPMALINEMFDKLPKEVWSDPDKKWLDPANGIGNFPMVAYMRLMEGLKDTPRLSNPQERSKHIIKEMLYMVEINPKNVKISRRIFGSNANICCADFLNEEDKVMRQFSVDKYDVIIGNPPFQTPKKEDTGTTAGKGIIWNLFIKSSLKLLQSGGLLGFITPPPWRKPENELYDIMTKDNQLLYLHIFGEKQVQKIFHVSQRIDLYVIEKKPRYKNTHIIDEEGQDTTIDLMNWPFLPNYDYDDIKKIILSEGDGIPIIYNTFYHSSKNMNKTLKDKTSIYKYPVIHGITLEGLALIYSKDKELGHFGVPKVILNANRNQYPVNDYEGKYGMSELSFGIPIKTKKEGDDIVRAINTSEFKEIIKATKWGAFQTDYHMFKYFRPDFYKQFLGKTSASTKLQPVERGPPQLQKTRKHRKQETEKKHPSDKKGGSRSRRRSYAQKHRDTRKKGYSWFF